MSAGLTSSSIRRVIIDPKTTSNLYAAALSNVTKGGVFKSVAVGSWTLPTNTLTNTNVTMLAIDPVTTSNSTQPHPAMGPSEYSKAPTRLPHGPPAVPVCPRLPAASLSPPWLSIPVLPPRFTPVCALLLSN